MKSGWIGSITNTPEETIKQAKHFASFIEKGDIYALIGELATGKTTFIKGVMKGLNYNKDVTSPTFTLVKSVSFPNS